MGLFDFINANKGDSAEGAANIGDALVTIEDVIAPGAVSVESRNINMSGKLCRVFFVVTYPRYLNDGWLEPILNIEKEVDVSIVVHPIDTADTLKKLQKKSAELQSQINIEADKGLVRNPQLEAALRNVEMLRDKLQQLSLIHI